MHEDIATSEFATESDRILTAVTGGSNDLLLKILNGHVSPSRILQSFPEHLTEWFDADGALRGDLVDCETREDAYLWTARALDIRDAVIGVMKDLLPNLAASAWPANWCGTRLALDIVRLVSTAIGASVSGLPFCRSTEQLFELEQVTKAPLRAIITLATYLNYSADAPRGVPRKCARYCGSVFQWAKAGLDALREFRRPDIANHAQGILDEIRGQATDLIPLLFASKDPSNEVLIAFVEGRSAGPSTVSNKSNYFLLLQATISEFDGMRLEDEIEAIMLPVANARGWGDNPHLDTFESVTRAIQDRRRLSGKRRNSLERNCTVALKDLGYDAQEFMNRRQKQRSRQRQLELLDELRKAKPAAFRDTVMKKLKRHNGKLGAVASEMGNCGKSVLEQWICEDVDLLAAVIKNYQSLERSLDDRKRRTDGTRG